jgi:Peptidase family S41
MSTDELISRLTGWLGRLMPAGPRRDRLTDDLRATFGGRDDPLTEEVCRAVVACAQKHSRHLELFFTADATASPDSEPVGWGTPDDAGIRARGGGVSAVRRLDDGTVVLTVDGLETYGIAQPYVDAAFTLAQGASRLVLDLRANGGGDPATVAAIAGRLLGDGARHLSDVVYADRRRQWWTPELPSGTALAVDTTVLVSSRTYSSAEALAYHLQARKRVTVVGETTRGAADHVTPIQLTPQVFGLLPQATVVDAVTGTNWEGAGVRPDEPCPADDALRVVTAKRP